MRRRVVANLLLVSILLCLSACAEKLDIPSEPLATNTTIEGTQSTEMGETIHTPIPVEIPKSYPVPKEGRHPSILYSHGVASTQRDGYYGKAGTALTYFDAASGEKMFLCDQPGCQHSDETCKAYLGGYPADLLEYRGMVYASVYETPQFSGDTKLVQKNPQTGELKIIGSWNATETERYYTSTYFASDGLLVYSRQKVLIGDGAEEFPDETFLYDIDADESKPYPIKSRQIFGLTKDYVVVDDYDFEKQKELYLSDAYNSGKYTMLDESIYIDAAIRRYDLHTGEYKEIVSAKKDGYVSNWEDLDTYGSLTIYGLQGTVYLYDMENDQVREFLKVPDNMDFATCWLSDGKVFVLTGDDEEVKIYYSDIDSPEWIPVDNRGEDSMVFSIYGEIDSMFYGLYHGCNSLIPKKDFYAANYEAARAGGV